VFSAEAPSESRGFGFGACETATPSRSECLAGAGFCFRIDGMARKNVGGVCKLCLRSGKLCKSHYMSRVLHALSRTGKEHPVVMTPGLIQTTPRQLWAHLLCESCEQLLNNRGEKPVLALFNGAKDNFPLLNRMNLALPLKAGPTVIIYSGEAMGINTEPLAYYALSVLWKGSVHEWTTLKGQKSSIDLGKYQEPIRGYLLGEAAFPDGVYVNVTACVDRGSQGMNYAPSGAVGPPYPMYSLLVRGLWFHVITTDSAPPGLSDLCCVRSTNRMLFKADCTEPFLLAARHIHKTATVSADLR